MEARLWAELHGFTYFETSAHSGQGVTDMFQVRPGGPAVESDMSVLQGLLLTDSEAG